MIGLAGIFLLIFSIAMGANTLVRYKKKFGFMSREDQERYRLISKKNKTERTEKEQDFYLQTQNEYYVWKCAKICFKIGSALVLLQASILVIYNT